MPDRVVITDVHLKIDEGGIEALLDFEEEIPIHGSVTIERLLPYLGIPWDG